MKIFSILRVSSFTNKWTKNDMDKNSYMSFLSNEFSKTFEDIFTMRFFLYQYLKYANLRKIYLKIKV